MLAILLLGKRDVSGEIQKLNLKELLSKNPNEDVLNKLNDILNKLTDNINNKKTSSETPTSIETQTTELDNIYNEIDPLLAQYGIPKPEKPINTTLLLTLIKALVNKINGDNEEINTLKATLKNKEDSLNNMIEEIKKINARITEIEKLLNERLPKEEEEALNTELERLKNDLEVANAKIAELEEEIAGLKNQIAELNAQLEAKNIKISNCEEEIKKRDNTIKELQDQINTLQSDSKESEGELEDQITGLKAELEAKEKEKGELKVQLEEKEKEKGEEKEKADTKITELEEKIAELTRQLEEKNNKITELEKKIAYLEREILINLNKIQKYKDDYEDIIRQRDAKIAELEKEIENLKKAHGESKESEGKLSNSNAKIAVLEGQIAELNRNCESDKQKLLVATQRIKELEAELDAARKTCTDNKGACDSLKVELEEAKAKVKIFGEDKTKWFNLVVELREQLAIRDKRIEQLLLLLGIDDKLRGEIQQFISEEGKEDKPSAELEAEIKSFIKDNNQVGDVISYSLKLIEDQMKGFYALGIDNAVKTDIFKIINIDPRYKRDNKKEFNELLKIMVELFIDGVFKKERSSEVDLKGYPYLYELYSKITPSVGNKPKIQTDLYNEAIKKFIEDDKSLLYINGLYKSNRDIGQFVLHRLTDKDDRKGRWPDFPNKGDPKYEQKYIPLNIFVIRFLQLLKNLLSKAPITGDQSKDFIVVNAGIPIGKVKREINNSIYKEINNSIYKKI